MKKNSGRRFFLKNISVGSIAALMAPEDLLSKSSDAERSSSKKNEPKSTFNDARKRYNEAYTNEYLNRVAFPIGGMGAGMFCMEGTGAISHMSIRNKPDVFNEPGLFAAISVKELKNGAKVLEGPVPDWKKFGQKDAGNGLGGSTTGLPRFHH